MLRYQTFTTLILLSYLIWAQLFLVAVCQSPCQGITRLELDDDNPAISINSPSYPANYKHPVNCQWIIHQSNRTNRIKLEFDMIHIAHSNISSKNHSIGFMNNRCKRQYIQVVDIFAVPHLVGKFCGNQVPSPIISAGSVLRVQFVSRNSQSKFKATASSTEEYCGTHKKMATTSVELLSSPKYSNPYPSNARCYWKLQAAPNHVILLDFMDIHLQDSTNCEKDGITIYNGGGLSAPLLGVICGVNTDNVKPSMVSTSNQMFIAFKSDDTEPTYNGFSAYYVARKVEYCDNVTTIISEDTVLSTPGYPDGYSGKSNCYNQWLVQAPKIDDTIKISMADIVLPPNIPCVNCYMRIFDGPDSNSKILATICSATLADEYTSSTNELYIEFYTAFPWTGNSGIAANISIIEIPEVQHPNGNHSNHHPDDHIPNGSGYNPAGAIAVFVSIVLMTVIVYVTNKYKIRCSRNRRRRGSDHFALVNEMDT